MRQLIYDFRERDCCYMRKSDRLDGVRDLPGRLWVDNSSFLKGENSLKRRIKYNKVPTKFAHYMVEQNEILIEIF